MIQENIWKCTGLVPPIDRAGKALHLGLGGPLGYFETETIQFFERLRELDPKLTEHWA